MYTLLLICAMAIGQEKAAPSDGITQSPDDTVIQRVATTTENFELIKSAFETELTTVQIEQGKDKNTIQIQGKRKDVEKAQALLVDRGLAVAPQKVSRNLPIVSGKSEEIRAAIEALKVKGIEFGFIKTIDSHCLRIEASSEEEIDVIEEVLNNLGLVFVTTKFKVFQLTYQSAEDVTNSLTSKLGAKQKFVPDARLNRIVVSGDREFFKRVQELIAKLDVANPEPATQSPGTSAPPKDMKIFRLQHIAADGAAAL